MKKQIMPAVKTHLLRGACLLALLFLVIQVMPRALGQRQTSNRNPAAEAPGMSNVNDAVPEVPTVCPGWSAGADLPSPGVRLAGVYFPANGKFYGMGGRSSDVAGSDFTHPFEYDPGTNTWTIKSATYPDNQVNNMACGVLNDNGTDYIYCVGGSAATQVVATGRVFRYDPVTDTISTIASPWPGDADGITLPGGFSVFNNKLYILGGSGSTRR